MIRPILLLLAVGAALSVQAIEIVPLDSPAATGAMGSSITRGPDGTVWLSWLEPHSDGKATALRFSRFDAHARKWWPAQTIAAGQNWLSNWADFPSLTFLSNSQALATWSVMNPPPPHAHASGGHHAETYHAVYSLSEDTGRTWSAPQPITGESQLVEFVATLALGENGRALGVWLDGRAREKNGGVQQLYAQTLLAEGGDQLVDPSVCDCCQISLVRVPDGALAAYRGRTSEEVRDIRLARWRNGAWEKPRVLHEDNWKIAACPVNGPRLAARGRDVTAVWFTGAQEQARVQAKLSHDGGENFGPAVRLDLGHPTGRVDAAYVGESAVFTWLELPARDGSHAGGIYLRVVGPDGAAGTPQLLAATASGRPTGFPRIARVDDTHLLVSYTVEGDTTRVATLLVALK